MHEYYLALRFAHSEDLIDVHTLSHLWMRKDILTVMDDFDTFENEKDK